MSFKNQIGNVYGGMRQYGGDHNENRVDKSSRIDNSHNIHVGTMSGGTIDAGVKTFNTLKAGPSKARAKAGPSKVRDKAGPSKVHDKADPSKADPPKEVNQYSAETININYLGSPTLTPTTDAKSESTKPSGRPMVRKKQQGKCKEPFTILMVGGMGCGKSTLAKALCGNHCAVAGESDIGVTQKHAFLDVKPAICELLDVDSATVIDCPGTGDPNLTVSKLIGEVELALKASKKVHAILLMKDAAETRLHLCVRIAMIILDMKFAKADQIIGVMTKADIGSPKKIKKRMKDWEKNLKKELGDTIPIALCGIPVMEEEPYHVIDPEGFEKWTKPNLGEVLEHLYNLARKMEPAQWVEESCDDEMWERIDKSGGLELTEKQKKKHQEELEHVREEHKRTLADLERKLQRKMQEHEESMRQQRLLQQQERKEWRRQQLLQQQQYEERMRQQRLQEDQDRQEWMRNVQLQQERERQEWRRNLQLQQERERREWRRQQLLQQQYEERMRQPARQPEYVCPVITQVRLTTKEHGNNYANCDGLYIRTNATLNGKPVYVCSQKDRFIGWNKNSWAVTATTRYYDKIMSGNIPSPFGGFDFGSSLTSSWNKYYKASTN